MYMFFVVLEVIGCRDVSHNFQNGFKFRCMSVHPGVRLNSTSHASLSNYYTYSS